MLNPKSKTVALKGFMVLFLNGKAFQDVFHFPTKMGPKLLKLLKKSRLNTLTSKNDRNSRERLTLRVSKASKTEQPMNFKFLPCFWTQNERGGAILDVP